ncbi:MAG: hypothetical protein QXN66_04630 [Thermoplasmatales archaeon]
MEDLEKVQSTLPFLIFKTSGYEILNPTIRPEGSKWSTLRYELLVDGEKARVKEFFLDWFYQGFPKNLMDSFVSSYAPVEAIQMEDSVFFVGKDYKGMHASSAFILGTEIEVEGESKECVEKVSRSLAPVNKLEIFRKLPFCSRSFFARGGKPDWFEERRIASLSWRPSMNNRKLEQLKADSVGILTLGEGVIHKISVFTEDFMKRVIWIDSSKKEIPDSNSYYKLRRDGNFYDTYQEIGGLLAFKQPSGPAIFQTSIEDNVVTISFSPLFRLQEIRNLIVKIINDKKDLFLL